MHETAAERERRLRQTGGGSEIWGNVDYIMSQWIIQNPCREIEKVREETDVSLVKKYDMGSFKFI